MPFTPELDSWSHFIYNYQQPRKNLILPNGFSLTCHVTNEHLQVVRSLNEPYSYLPTSRVLVV